jgi:hypothetical protein
MKARMPSGPDDVGSIESDDGQIIARITGDYIDFGERAVVGLGGGGCGNGVPVTRVNQLDTQLTGKDLDKMGPIVGSNKEMLDILVPQAEKLFDRIVKEVNDRVDGENATAATIAGLATAEHIAGQREILEETVEGYKTWVGEQLAAAQDVHDKAMAALEAQLDAEFSTVTAELVAITDAQKLFDIFVADLAGGASAKQAALNVRTDHG